MRKEKNFVYACLEQNNRKRKRKESMKGIKRIKKRKEKKKQQPQHKDRLYGYVLHACIIKKNQQECSIIKIRRNVAWMHNKHNKNQELCSMRNLYITMMFRRYPS